MSTATHILVATDLTEASDPAIANGGKLALALDAKLSVLHVHGRPPAPPEAVVAPDRLVFSEDLDADAMICLDNLKRRILADVEWVSIRTLEDGDPAHGICEYARDHGVDLIVLGSHGRSGLSRLVHRSVAEKVLKQAPCAVLVVPNREAPVLC